MNVATANAIFLLGKHDDRAALGRFVGKRGKLGRIGKLLLIHTLDRHEGHRLTIAERDGSGLVEEKRIDVACRFDGAARHGEHVEANQPVHAGNTDSGQEAHRSWSG